MNTNTNSNTKIKTTLKILPHLNYEINCIPTVQKCLIPSELIPDKNFNLLRETIYGKCIELHNKKEYICKLNSLHNNYPLNYCYLDESVYINTKTSDPDNQEQIPSTFSNASESISEEDKEKCRELSCIEILNYEDMPAEQISVIITLNENALNKKLSISQLIDILKNLLQLYVIMEDVHIDFNNNSSSIYKNICGINDIYVTKISHSLASTSSWKQSVFKINHKTKINIENIKYKNIDFIKSTDLEDLNDISLELNKLIDDMKLENINSLYNHIRPSSLMTLLIGLSGSGKTSICYNFFIKNQCNVFEIIPIKIFGQYPGETEENLQKIFHNAIYFITKFKPKDPTVIFIENIELICSSSRANPSSLSSGSDNVVAQSSRISNHFLSLLDAVNQTKNLKLLIIGTTSNVEQIDLALRRPGRFENELSIPLLTENGRKNILMKFIKKLFSNIEDNEDLDKLSFELAQKCIGFIGSDMKLLIHNFNKKMIKKNCNQIKGYGDGKMKLNDVKNDIEEILKVMKPSILQGADVTCITCDEKLDNIGGMEQLKNTLKVSVLAALKCPEIYKKFGLELPKGILLYGPPGCAKTTIAKCLATETKMRFISISGAEVYSPYVGKAEKFITKIFDTARKNSPCIIFLDEIDTLVGNRQLNSNTKNDVQIRVLSTLLTEMDGIGILRMKNFSINTNNIKILIVAATNRPDLIDNALLRPGRFDKLIHVTAPNKQSRYEIFQIYSKRMPFNDDIDYELLSKLTENYSGADICNLCNETAIYALTKHSDIEKIFMNDFIEIMKKFKSSLTQEQIDWYKKFEEKYYT